MNKGQVIILAISIAAVIALVINFRGSRMPQDGEASARWNELPPNQWPEGLQSDIPADESFSVTLLGEIAIDKVPGEPAKLMAPFDELLESSDAVIAGLGMPLDATSDLLPLMAERNFKGLAVANPSILAKGADGARETVAALAGHGIAAIGAGGDAEESSRPFVIEGAVGRSKLKVAIFAAGEDLPDSATAAEAGNDDEPGDVERIRLNGLDVDRLAEQIKEFAETDPDAVIVVAVGWGREYRWISSRQRNWGRKLAEAGADVVFGYGSRMMQQVDEHQGGFIFHNLGDFAVDRPFEPERAKEAVPYGMVLRLVGVEREGELKHVLRMYPTVLDQVSERFISAERFSDFYYHLITRSWLKDDRWLKRELGVGYDRFGRFLRVGASGYIN